MKIVKHEGKRRLFDQSQTLILMDESTLDRIIEDPSQPLLQQEEKGVSGEETRMYDTTTSLLDVCKEGEANGAQRLEVSYDFFFGGSKRENYPDSPATLKAYKIIHDLAKEHGMGFSASVVSPLDVGGGYAKSHRDTGRTMQFKEGLTLEDGTRTLPARLVIQKASGTAEDDGKADSSLSEIELTIHEGKFHQVKRMFEAVGCRVVYLKRLSMGSLRVDESLAPGAYRRLTEEEISKLQGEGASGDERGLLSGKRAFLFDLDGTLVDSMWMWGAIDIEYLGKFGIPCPKDLQKAIEGMSFTETAVYFKERFSLPDSLEQIKADWTAMSIEKYRTEVPLKPGVRRFLEKAAERDIKMAICTSNGREMVDAVLSALKIRDFFSCVITGCEVAAGKPSPDIYLEAARRLSVKPEECAVFEDVPAGILSGKRAGMTVFAVEDDFSKGMEQEKRRLADGYIDGYLALL